MLRPWQVIIACSLALLCIGLVMVSSAAMSLGGSPVTAQSIIFSRVGLYAGISVALLGVVALLPVRRIMLWISGESAALPCHRPLPEVGAVGCSPRLGVSEAPASPSRGRWHGGSGLPLLLIGTLLLLSAVATVYIPGIAAPKNNSHRWIEIPISGSRPISVQPSEIAKWGMVFLLAVVLTRRWAMMGRFFVGALPMLAALGAVVLLVGIEDFGTAALIACVGGVLLLAGGMRIWQAGLLAPIGIGALAYLVIKEPYRVRRLTTFVDPFHDPQGAGYHMIQSMTTIAGGGPFGRGLGNGLQKFGYLPEQTTDFLFAVLCEEMGLAGAALVISLYLGILGASMLILLREKTLVCRLAVIGVAATLGVQAVINIAVVTGWAPTKGIPLPLISAGGTGWLMTSFSLGAIISIGRSQEKLAAAEAEPEWDDEIELAPEPA
ncbi:MAG: FtsW/RodA/SpoVE family cell cycle protein [Phycisphaerales bacterium]|nr:FtsW/RodA/SpoVE family cell cycle protein [Phycisphaerales bacterium]